MRLGSLVLDTLTLAAIVIGALLIGALITLLLVYGPGTDFSGIANQILLLFQPSAPIPDITDPDLARYLFLKNLSCGVLSDDFLIATDDISEGTLIGLTPATSQEVEIAKIIIDEYNSNSTTKTYVLGDQMKKVEIRNGIESSTIWKNGRVYSCKGSCIMHILSQNESDEYYDLLYKMRNNCMHFGKTPLPDEVDLNALLDMEYGGKLDIGSYRCDSFIINGNKSYAESILKNVSLNDDQQALVWAIAHLNGPMQECLDETTGIIVMRDLSLNIRDSYNFDFAPDGEMSIRQKTRLTYFDTEVPESFLTVPS